MRWPGLLKTITTDWVYNPHPLLHTKQRFVGPAWVSWLIVRAEGKRLHPLLQRLVALSFRLSGAHYEIQDLTASEIAGKQQAAEFVRLFEKIGSIGRLANWDRTQFAGLSGLINTGNTGPGLESTDAHA